MAVIGSATPVMEGSMKLSEVDGKGVKQRNLEEIFKLALAEVDDINREGLRDTPKRWAKMFLEVTSGHAFDFTVFRNEGYDQMIIEAGIPFYSLCEHHVAQFWGKATVAYIPGKNIVGISKLARTVEHFSKQLQVQERMTQQIADLLEKELKPQGVGVLIRARHSCQEVRGIRKPGTETITSCLKGEFLKQEVREEFMRLAGK